MKIRPATVGDVPKIAPIHQEAFKGQMSALVGRHYTEALLRWFIQQPGAVVRVAEENGEILGYVFGAPDGYSVGMNRQLAPWIVAGVVRHFPALIAHPNFRRQLVNRVTNLVLGRQPHNVIEAATPSGTFCLVGIGTASSARRRGVAGRLIAELCSAAEGRPVILDVFTNNSPAVEAYSKAGFTVLTSENQVQRMIRR